jgi:hypothetical protein
VVPVLSTLMMYLKFGMAAPFVTPAPPLKRGSVRALMTLSVRVLVAASACADGNTACRPSIRTRARAEPRIRWRAGRREDCWVTVVLLGRDAGW